MQRVLIVGAGFTGAVIAHVLANNGIPSTVIDRRSHVGGNCYTYADKETGVTVHGYGPHIFHTDDKEVWDFVGQFAVMRPFILRMKATAQSRVFSLPINLQTINQFYGKTFTPAEAESFIAGLRAFEGNPRTFEEQALASVGPDLYEAFFKGYPQKQWGLHPSKLPAEILKRLPIRFNYDDNYFRHKYQAIPDGGYTQIFERLLKNPLIEVKLSCPYTHDLRLGYAHTFYSGPFDSWFNFRFGSLQYRTIRFEKSIHDGDYQGCAVMSYPDLDTPFTRVTEHKHFTPWERHEKSVVFHEFSQPCNKGDDPFYPMRLDSERKTLALYLAEAEKETDVSFVGRLGTYRYIDMDVTVREALDAARGFINSRKEKQKAPAFFAPMA